MNKVGLWALNLEQGEAYLLSKAKAAAEYRAAIAKGANALALADFLPPQRQKMAIDGNGIATVHLLGALCNGLSNIEKMLGDTDYADLAAEIADCANNPKVRGVFIAANSPGGEVMGCPEVADAVAALAVKKPVCTHNGGLCCSAAEFATAGSTLKYAGKSSISGSIGVIRMLTIYAGMLEEAGISVKVITPEKCDLKGTGNPYVEPTEAQMASMQAQVEALNSKFRAHIKAFRGDVPESAMRGQGLLAEDALAAGLIDGIATYEQAYADLLGLVRLRS